MRLLETLKLMCMLFSDPTLGLPSIELSINCDFTTRAHIPALSNQTSYPTFPFKRVGTLLSPNSTMPCCSSRKPATSGDGVNTVSSNLKPAKARIDKRPSENAVGGGELEMKEEDEDAVEMSVVGYFPNQFIHSQR